MARKKSEVNTEERDALRKLRGDNLRKVLSSHGMSQSTLADKIGYTPEHVSYIVNGIRNLTLEAAEKVVDLFPDVRLDWLMGYGGYMNWEEEVAAQSEKIVNSFARNERLENSIKELIECLGYKIQVRLRGIQHEDGVIYHDGSVESCRIVSPDGIKEEITYNELQKIIYNIKTFAKCELSKQFDANWQLLREGDIDG